MTSPIHRLLLRASAVTAAALLLAGCSAPGGTGGQGGIPNSGGVDTSAPTLEMVTVMDPVENSFTVDVPVGWDSVAYASGQFDVHREVVSSVSPDGGTVLFLGDPKIPNYWNPDTANPVTVDFANLLDYMELRHYTPAETYFGDYTALKFGELPDFELVAIESLPEVVQSLQQQFVDAGYAAPEAHAAEVSFTYTAERGPINAVVIGLTINYGDFWQVDVRGLSTDRTVADYLPMLSAMANSKQTTQEFLDRSAANHAQIMEDIRLATEAMTQQHYANMAAIQASAQRHQSRMEAIWAQGDASMQSYYNRMESMDNTQQSFLNYINDEHTVASPSGQTWQVDDGYDRYWVNQNDGSYVGGDINFDDTTLLELGLNPSDYQEVTVIR